MQEPAKEDTDVKASLKKIIEFNQDSDEDISLGKGSLGRKAKFFEEVFM